MNFFLTSAYPYDSTRNFAVQWLSISANLDSKKEHILVKEPVKADIILFVEHHPSEDPYFFEILKNSIYKQFKSKCYLYHDNPRVLPLLPGVYPSIEKKYYIPLLMRPGPYIARLCLNDQINFSGQKPDKKYLFSFIGAKRTYIKRKEILELAHKNSFLKDTSDKNLWELNPIQKKEFEGEFVKISVLSHFVLCPRGVGPNSYRLFECMEMGIAPVIISDEWVPMEGPDWDSFSIRIPEKNINQIPFILESKKKNSKIMGLNARKNWEEWFSQEVCFHHIAEACKDLNEKKEEVNVFKWIKIYLQFLRPFHFRNLMRYMRNRFFKKKSILQKV